MKNIAALVVLLALAACAGGDKPEEEKVAPKAEIKTGNLICPQVAILKEAEEIIDFGHENPDPAQLVAKARMKSIDGDCGYRTGDIEDSGIDIEFTLHSVAARGPRLGGKQVGFPFFVAVVDPSDDIVSREAMTATYKFSGDDKVKELDEELHIFIPMPEASLIAGPDYRVLVGFKQPVSGR